MVEATSDQVSRVDLPSGPITLQSLDKLAANLTITEICFLVGFESVGSFSSRFRDLVGMSPTEYRSASAGAPPIPGCFVLMWTRPGLARSQQSGRSTDNGRAVALGP